MGLPSEPKQQTMLAGSPCSKCLVIRLVCFSYIMNFFNSTHLIFISPLILHSQVPQTLGPKCPRLIIYTVIVFQHETMVGLPHIHLFFIHWPTMHLIYTQCPSVEPICECGLKTEVRRSSWLTVNCSCISWIAGIEVCCVFI